MISGQVRDRFPRAELILPGRAGHFSVVFIVDTAFDGDLALPYDIAQRLDVINSGRRSLLLANGGVVEAPYYEIDLEWNEDIRRTEVLVMGGNALLGVELLEGLLLQVEMVPDGAVSAEPL